MLRSRTVAKENPSISCNTMLIFGIGKGFLTNLLFTSWKSLKKHTILSFLGIMKDGKAHSDAGCLSNTSSLHNLSTSFMMVSLWMFGTEKTWPWWGDTPTYNWNETSLVFQSLKVPSKSGLYFLSSCIISFGDRHLDDCKYFWQLTGDLLSDIWHLGSAWHAWLHPGCFAVPWLGCG